MGTVTQIVLFSESGRPTILDSAELSRVEKMYGTTHSLHVPSAYPPKSSYRC